MADILVTKQAAAQRQIDAAIRIMFAEEDPLAIHTIVNAARTVLIDLAGKSDRKPVLSDAYEHALQKLQEHFPHKTSHWDLRTFRTWYQRVTSQSGNFLKHADRDPARTLNPASMDTDHLLLEACSIYQDLGFDPTPEMKAFARWHLAVYPHEESDPIKTDEGFVHELERTKQLWVGAFLLDQSRKGQREENVTKT